MLGWCVSIGLLFGSVLLLVLGVRGWRRGRERVCAKCGYDVRGLESPRCPECGLLLDEKGVAIGVRRRSPVMACIGAVLFAAGGLVGFVKGYKVDPYPHLPFVWVLSSADGGNAKAFAEVSRRLKAGELAAAQVERLAGRCLDIQADEDRVDAQQWIDLLEYMDTNIGLRKEDRQRYYEEAIHSLEFDFEGASYVGGELKIRFSIETRLPGFGMTAMVCPQNLWVDGTLTRSVGITSKEASGIGHWEGVLEAKVEAARGRHTVEFEGGLYFFRLSHPLPTEDIRITGIVEFSAICTSERALQVESESDPRLRKTILDALQVETGLHLAYPNPDTEAVPCFVPSFKLLEPLSCGLAFDVIVRMESVEYRAGELTCVSESTEIEFKRTANLNGFPETQGLVVLRPNPQLLFPSDRTMAIWDEELVLGPIKLGRMERE